MIQAEYLGVGTKQPQFGETFSYISSPTVQVLVSAMLYTSIQVNNIGSHRYTESELCLDSKSPFLTVLTGAAVSQRSLMKHCLLRMEICTLQP